MSRYSKLPLSIREGVTVSVSGNAITVKGKKGELSMNLHDSVTASVADNKVNFKASGVLEKCENFIGLSWRLVQNMIIGVDQGYEKKLELQGVGYRMALKENNLTLQLGFSHDISYQIPSEVSAKVEGSFLTLSSIDKQLVGCIADKIKAYKPVEPYKGKGFRYFGEKIIKKAGKSNG